MEKIDIVNAAGTSLATSAQAVLEYDGGAVLIVAPQLRLSHAAVAVMLVTGKGLMQALAYSKIRIGADSPAQGFVLLHGRVAVLDKGDPVVEDFAVATGPDYRGTTWGRLGKPQHIRRSAEMLRALGQARTSPSA